MFWLIVAASTALAAVGGLLLSCVTGSVESGRRGVVVAARPLPPPIVATCGGSRCAAGSGSCGCVCHGRVGGHR